MSRASRFGALLRQAWSLSSAGNAAAVARDAPQVAARAAALHAQRTFAAGAGEVTDIKEFGHVTGLEKFELESKVKGVDVWEESWLQAPFGTADNPVVVPSIEPSRIVGVPDPDDDSLVWWAMIEEGDGPRQIIEGGEYFVLKRIPGGDSHHH